MKSMWDGTISFGLVNIGVSVYPATKKNEIGFHFLHADDGGRIYNERYCTSCGKKVAYQDIVRGYEYEKDRYVSLTAKDLENVQIESAKTIDILNFVATEDIDPMFFHHPYYLSPAKNNDKAYVLLRDALKATHKVAIAKLIFRTRESLAAVKPRGSMLMLDLMHFGSEIRSAEELKQPHASRVNKKEIEMAKDLIESMTEKFDASKYHDTYREHLMKLIDRKLKGKTISSHPHKEEPTNVIDLMSKLKASLQKKKPHVASSRKRRSA